MNNVGVIDTFLNTFTTYIASDRRVVALSCNLVYFININNSFLCSINIKIANLQKAA